MGTLQFAASGWDSRSSENSVTAPGLWLRCQQRLPRRGNGAVRLTRIEKSLTQHRHQFQHQSCHS